MTVEVRIGVRDVAREITFESQQAPDEVEQLVNDAITSGTVLSLTDDKGRRVVVPVQALGYVDIGVETRGRVGFGTY